MDFLCVETNKMYKVLFWKKKKEKKTVIFQNFIVGIFTNIQFVNVIIFVLSLE